MNLISIIFLPIIPFKSFYFWKKANNKNLPGRKFATFGFRLAFKLFLKGKISLKLFFNPVSIVRYFEYGFAHSCIENIKEKNILDVSSPYLFGFYLASKNECNYNYINPDKSDVHNINSLVKKIKFIGSYSTNCFDAIKLPYENNNFDRIVSISVIEHVSGNNDSEVMQEMWRVLRPNGLLILTFPVKKEYEEEFIGKDIYNLKVNENEGKFFFQRYYDDEKIEQRLLSSLNNFEIIEKRVFGEINNDFYNHYKKRWEKYGYWETVKDPYYISKRFKYYPNIEELNGLGVMGLTIKKLK